MEFIMKEKEAAQESFRYISRKATLEQISFGLDGQGVKVEWVWDLEEMKIYLSGVPTHIPEDVLSDIFFGDLLRFPRENLLKWERLHNEFGAERDVIILTYNETPRLFHVLDLASQHFFSIPGARIYWHWILPPTQYVPWCKHCTLAHMERVCPTIADDGKVFESQNHVQLPPLSKQTFTPTWTTAPWEEPEDEEGEEENPSDWQEQWPKLGEQPTDQCNKKRSREERDNPNEDYVNSTEPPPHTQDENFDVQMTGPGPRDADGMSAEDEPRRKIFFPRNSRRNERPQDTASQDTDKPIDDPRPLPTLGDWMGSQNNTTRGKRGRRGRGRRGGL